MEERRTVRASSLAAIALLRRTWPDALAFGIAFRLLGLFVLAPVVSVVTRAMLAASGHRVVANADLLGFALSGWGVATIFVVAVLLVATTLGGQAGALTIAYGAVHGRRVGAWTALRTVGRCAPGLIALGFAATWRVALLAVPLLLVIAGAHGWLISEHDINYYLTFGPPEFVIALAIAGVASLAFAVLLLRVLVGWSLAVPLVVLDGRAGPAALRESRRIVQGRRWPTFLRLAPLPACSVLAGVLLVAAVTWLGDVALDATLGRLRATAMILGVTAVLITAALFVGDLLAGSTLAHVTAVVHRQWVADDALLRPPVDDGPLDGRHRGARGKLIVAAGGLAIASVFVGTRLLADIDGQDDVRTIAHRAAARLGPENSLAALRAAIAAGADSAEIDVQRTADGAIAVIHDRDLMKLAGRAWRVADTPLARFREADIGHGERVATLGEFVDAAKGRIALCVELKYYGWDEELAPAVVALLRAEGVMATSEIISLEKRALAQLRRIAPEARIGFLSSVAIGDVSRVDADFLAVADRAATTALVHAATARGLDVYAWTLNTEDAVSDAIDRGVRGVITDDPGIVRAVLDERAELGEVERLLLRFGALHGK